MAVIHTWIKNSMSKRWKLMEDGEELGKKAKKQKQMNKSYPSKIQKEPHSLSLKVWYQGLSQE